MNEESTYNSGDAGGTVAVDAVGLGSITANKLVGVMEFQLS